MWIFFTMVQKTMQEISWSTQSEVCLFYRNTIYIIHCICLYFFDCELPKSVHVTSVALLSVVGEGTLKNCHHLAGVLKHDLQNGNHFIEVIRWAPSFIGVLLIRRNSLTGIVYCLGFGFGNLFFRDEGGHTLMMCPEGHIISVMLTCTVKIRFLLHVFPRIRIMIRQHTNIMRV